ncbi:MAG: riboflavin biosynthesis protein RibF [Paramuribaculum sp.]|nr:riboflavin biosynthesis protein RibF [Paramuribaculum sp.]
MSELLLPGVMAVGTFDGVHAGHRHLLSSLKAYALAHTLRPVAVTFSHHPLRVIAPDKKLRLLSDDDKRISMLKHAADEVIVLDFDESMLRTPAEDFLRMLRDRYGMAAFFTGHDTVLGHDRLSGERLAEVCRRLGVVYVDEADCLLSPDDGAQVSSSYIRSLIAHGDVAGASFLLGYDYSVSGTVVHGNHIGTGIGFPTANIVPPADILTPGGGVYAAYIFTPDGIRRPAVVNIGTRPTVTSDENMTIEAHLPDYNGNLYGLQLTVTFVARLRSECKFASLSALKFQLAKDVEQAKSLLVGRQ